MSKKHYYQRRVGSYAEYCCVPRCGTSSRYNSVLSFHSFPSDDYLRKTWTINIRRNSLIITPHTRVCSRHFRPEDVKDRKDLGGRRTLRKGAVPLLFPWNNYFAGGRLGGLEQLVLESEEEIISALAASHVSQDGYHYNTQQMTDIISARYYWPDMSERIKMWVDGCEECTKSDDRTSGDACGAAYRDRAPHKTNNEVTEPTRVRKAQDAELKASSSTDFKKHKMISDNGGNYLQCPYCYFQCNTKASFQIHVGSQHPLHCEDVSVGRLGKVIFYQRTASLFHCYICFFTARDYSKLFDHMLVKHCFSGKALGLKHKVSDVKEGCSVNKDSKDSDSSEVGHGEGSEQDKVPSPKMQPDSLIDVDTKVSLAEDPLKAEGQSFESGPLNGSNEDSTLSGSSSKRKRSSASCSEDEDDEEEDEDELDSSQAAKEEKNAAVLKYTEHLSTRYYYCKFCKWRSKKKGFLLYHVSQKHDVPKPHACKECKKSFMLEMLLTKHVKLCHKQGLYQCPFCPFESNFLRGIRRHLNNCKGEEDGETEGCTSVKKKE